MLIKFFPECAKRILSGEKTTTIGCKGSVDADVVAGDSVELVDTDDNHIAFATVLRVHHGFTINKYGQCISGYTLERIIFILTSEGMTWKELTGFIEKYYGLPFFGVVIEFELNDGVDCHAH